MQPAMYASATMNAKNSERTECNWAKQFERGLIVLILRKVLDVVFFPQSFENNWNALSSQNCIMSEFSGFAGTRCRVSALGMPRG